MLKKTKAILVITITLALASCSVQHQCSESKDNCEVINEIVEFIENERGQQYPIADSTIISEAMWVENYEMVDSTIGYFIYDDLIKKHREQNTVRKPVTCFLNLASTKASDSIYLGFSTPVFSSNGDYCLVYIETYHNPLSASGTVYIFELSSTRKKSIKKVRYKQVIWVS